MFIRLTYLYKNGDETDYIKHPFYTNTGYKPQFSCPAVENYLFATKVELSKIDICKQKSNITKGERLALKTLKNNKDIVIRKADKNSTLCIIDKDNYIKEGLRQLNDGIHYEEINNSNLTEVTKSALAIIQELYDHNKIDDTTLRYLKKDISNGKLGKFFLLPKIHKLPEHILKQMETNENIRKNTLIPGRPIVSLCGTPLHNIGHFIDYFLLPLTQKQETYIKDTSHFINKVENTRIPRQAYMVTFDAKNMYTNLEFNEIYLAIESALENMDINDYSIPVPPVKYLKDLLKLILENNEFFFNNKKYRQKIGVPMGGAASAELADIRMFEILKNIVQKFEHREKIIMCSRYRDDGFFYYNGPESEIETFFELANSEHAHLKFTYEFSRQEMIFLDTVIYKGERFENEQIPDIKTFIKPTETFQFLHRESSHPSSVFKAFIKGEILRYKRNTNSVTDFKAQTAAFKKRLINRKYSNTEIDKVIEETQNINRTDLLTKQKTDRTKPLVVITKFNPAVKGLKSKHKKTLEFIITK